MTEQALDQLARRVMLDAARLEYGALTEEPHTFSPAFEREMKKLVRQVDHPVRYRWLRTVQLAALLAALLLLVTAAAAAAGCDIWRLLAEWTAEEITLAPGRIEYADPDSLHIPEEPKAYAGLPEALADCGLNRSVAPKRMPEGFVMDHLVVDSLSDSREIVFFGSYCRGEKHLIIQVDVYLESEDGHTNSFWSFCKDEGDPTPYVAGGITHLLATNAGRPVALWANGPAECAVSGDITMDELKEMIDSIYE